jgi:CheY-like chemotaxis protein
MGRATNPRQPWILIVDDDENVLAIANDLIQRLGYNALIASNAVDALEILRRNQDVYVLVADIGMPGMNGEELARAAVAAGAARHPHFGRRSAADNRSDLCSEAIPVQRSDRRSRIRNTATTVPAASRKMFELERALAQLPLEQRQAILLVGLEGMSYEDAAGILSVPVGTIRSRLSRGRDVFASF